MITMARSGISSYITKSSTYPTSSSSYGSSYHIGSYSSKPTYSSSTYSKPTTLDYRRPPTSITPLRTRDSSTSGYLRSSTNYATTSYQPVRSTLTASTYEPKRYGFDRERASRRDTYGTKASVPTRTTTNYSSSYSSGYQSPSNYDRAYGRFSQERTTDVSRDLGELSLGSRVVPAFRRSSSHFDLASSRISVERASVGRDAEEKDVANSRVTPRIHPTMGGYGVEKRLGGSSEVEPVEEGKGEATDCSSDGQSSFYGGARSTRRSPSVDRRYVGSAEVEVARTKRFGSVDRFSSAKPSIVSSRSVSSRSCSGLRNIGNTCFMNSVLQCLAHTESLLEYCLENQYDADINQDASRMKGVLITAYAELMDAMWGGQETVVSPTKFKCEVARFAKLFLGYNQQDAQEFLLYLLQGLHEDVNRVREKKKRHFDDSNEIETISASEKARRSWKEHLEFENSKIVDLFEGQLKSALICTECGYVSNTFDPTLGLSLPIKKCHGGSVSLIDCLELFTQEETLDERTMCARCKRKQKATKQLSIQKFPQILIINLKRFNDENAYRSKLSTEVKCPLRNLDLKTFSAESVAGSIVYDLYAVSNHSGTPSGGHYTAAARNPYTKEWQYFNDHRVSTISESDVVTSEAYILFYELSSGSLSF